MLTERELLAIMATMLYGSAASFKKNLAGISPDSCVMKAREILAIVSKEDDEDKPV